MATHSSIVAWRTPRIEELGGLQSMGSHRVGQDWATKHKASPDDPLQKSLCLAPRASVGLHLWVPHAGLWLVDRGVYAIRRVQPLCTLTSLTLIIVVSLQIFSVLNSDDASAPALETQPQGDEEGECPQGAGWGSAGLGVDHGLVLRLAWDGLGLPFSSFIWEASCPCWGPPCVPWDFHTAHAERPLRRNLWAVILSPG